MTIHVDHYYGHVVVTNQDNVRDWHGTLAALVDFGETVSMHDKHLGPWTTQEAREVAAALIGWASRKDRESA